MVVFRNNCMEWLDYVLVKIFSGLCAAWEIVHSYGTKIYSFIMVFCFRKPLYYAAVAFYTVYGHYTGQSSKLLLNRFYRKAHYYSYKLKYTILTELSFNFKHWCFSEADQLRTENYKMICEMDRIVESLCEDVNQFEQIVHHAKQYEDEVLLKSKNQLLPDGYRIRFINDVRADCEKREIKRLLLGSIMEQYEGNKKKYVQLLEESKQYSIFNTLESESINFMYNFDLPKLGMSDRFEMSSYINSLFEVYNIKYPADLTCSDCFIFTFSLKKVKFLNFPLQNTDLICNPLLLSDQELKERQIRLNKYLKNIEDEYMYLNGCHMSWDVLSHDYESMMQKINGYHMKSKTLDKICLHIRVK